MEKVILLLQKYQVDPERGFLPSQDPLTELPSDYKVWDDLADNFTVYINAGVIRQRIDELPILENLEFCNSAELERAMMLLSFFGQAYVHATPEPKKYIPPSIAIPWVKVSNILKRKPIITHSSVVLNNWRRLDIDRMSST